MKTTANTQKPCTHERYLREISGCKGGILFFHEEAAANHTPIDPACFWAELALKRAINNYHAWCRRHGETPLA